MVASRLLSEISECVMWPQKDRAGLWFKHKTTWDERQSMKGSENPASLPSWTLLGMTMSPSHLSCLAGKKEKTLKATSEDGNPRLLPWNTHSSYCLHRQHMTCNLFCWLCTVVIHLLSTCCMHRLPAIPAIEQWECQPVLVISFPWSLPELSVPLYSFQTLPGPSHPTPGKSNSRDIDTERLSKWRERERPNMGYGSPF